MDDGGVGKTGCVQPGNEGRVVDHFADSAVGEADQARSAAHGFGYLDLRPLGPPFTK